MDVANSYLKVQQTVANIAKRCGRNPKEITIVAVSKFYPWEYIHSAYRAGCLDFGESRVQEALPKMAEAPDDARWHMIGSLQRNKVSKVVGKFALIHSVDHPDVARKIAQISAEKEIVTPILLQVNTSGEQSKHGLPPQEWLKEFEALLDVEGIEIDGLMTMAPLTEDEAVIRQCFGDLRKFRDKLREIAGEAFPLPSLSMGMSHDYHIAIEEGSTILRIGSAIFGEKSQPSVNKFD